MDDISIRSLKMYLQDSIQDFTFSMNRYEALKNHAALT